MTSSIDVRLRTSLAVVFLIRGALAVAAGLSILGLQVLAVVFPRITANVIVLLFGGYVLLDGLLAVAGSIRIRMRCDQWLAIQGALSLLAGGAMISGVVSLVSPLLYLLAGWGIITGGLELLAAREMRREYRALLAAVGVASILLGAVVLIFWPGPGLVPFVWLLVAYTVAVGVVRVLVGVR